MHRIITSAPAEELLEEFYPRVFKNEFASREIVESRVVPYYSKWSTHYATYVQTGYVRSALLRKNDGTTDHAQFWMKAGKTCYNFVTTAY